MVGDTVTRSEIEALVASVLTGPSCIFPFGIDVQQSSNCYSKLMTDDEKANLARMLHELIVGEVSGTSYLAKYGGVLYTLKPKEKEGQFCGVYIQKDHVQLVFSHGSSLKDPANILLGRGKGRRHVNFYAENEVPKSAICKLLQQASKI